MPRYGSLMDDRDASGLPPDWEDRVRRAYAAFGFEPQIAEFEGWNPTKQWRAPKGGEGGGRYVEMPDVKAVIDSSKRVAERGPQREAGRKNQEKQKEWRAKDRAAKAAGKRSPVKPKAIEPKPLPPESVSDPAPAPPKNPVNRKPFTPKGQTDYDAVSPGYRKATPEELDLYSHTPQYSGAHIAEDPDARNPVRLFQPGGGEPTRLYTFDHHLTAEREKWARVNRMMEEREGLQDAMTEKMRQGDDTATALRLVLETGMRPSSDNAASIEKDENGKAILDPATGKPPIDPRTGEVKKVPTYGASNLEGRHVKRQNKDGSVTLDFIGKSGVRNVITVKDKELADELMRRKGNAGPNGKLWDTSPGKMGATIKENASPDFKTKDMRTMLANVFAAQYMQDIIAAKGRTPKNQDEFVEWMEQATEMAARRLGNKPDTFRESYLSVIPFLDLIPGTGHDWEDYWEWGKKMKPKNKPFSILTELALRAGDRMRGTTLAKLTDEEFDRIYRESNEKMPTMDELVDKWLGRRDIVDLGPDDLPDENEPWDDPDDPLFPDAEGPIKEEIKEEVTQEIRPERRTPKRPPLG